METMGRKFLNSPIATCRKYRNFTLQQGAWCGLHALNNALQHRVFTQQQFRTVANALYLYQLEVAYCERLPSNMRPGGQVSFEVVASALQTLGPPRTLRHVVPGTVATWIEAVSCPMACSCYTWNWNASVNLNVTTGKRFSNHIQTVFR